MVDCQIPDDDLVGNVFNRQKFLVICWYLRFSVATVTVHCPRCNSDEVYRHGRSGSRHERFRCRSCKRVFQLTYSYEARKPGVKEQSVEMAHSGAGVRDTGRTLKIGINTVIRTLKSSRPGAEESPVMGG